jgi:RNA polymerase sigma-70 factor (ECF subfamily)
VAEAREPWFSDDASGRLAAAEVTALLWQLDPLDREILVARVWGGLSFEEVVAVVDRPLSTVHRRYRQALAWLGERMNADGTQAEVKR